MFLNYPFHLTQMIDYWFARLVILLSFASSSYCQENLYYNACIKSFNCGSLKNLSYPFWTDIDNGRSQMCGLGGFNLQCVDGELPVINIGNQEFLVLSVNQSQNEMAIVRKDLWDDSCPDTFNNITLNTALFSFVPDFYTKFSNISLFYICNDLQNTTQRFACPVNGAQLDSLYGYDGLRGRWMQESRKCEIKMEIPVPKASIRRQTLNNLGGVLRQGFNVSYNYDEGCAWCTTSGGICGTNVSTGGFTCFCPDQPYPLSCPNNSDIVGSNRRSNPKFGIALGASLATVSIMCILFFIFLRCKKNKLFSCSFIVLFMRNRLLTQNQDFEAFLESQGPLAIKRYNYSQVKKMTNSFNEKLGQGGYGTVYKGKILDGRLVAVKMLKVSKEELGEDFINEVAAISRTSHVNVVTLLGFCLQGQKRALVYEFMPNGSLDKFIRLKTTLDSDQHLGIEVIEQIAIGIAQGLEYLHRGCNTRIVHFDIKPHNVLLDENLSPKISDFGLAKLCTRNESMVSMLEARGTIGYIAPEVFSRNFGQVSSKSDVYSYGMMILEIIGARKKVEQVEGSNSSEMYFPSWIYKSLEFENGKDAISEDDKEGEVVRKLKLVGLWCIQTNPLDRPSMSKVIEILRGSTQTISIPPKPFLFSSSSAPPIQLSSYSSTT